MNMSLLSDRSVKITRGLNKQVFVILSFLSVICFCSPIESADSIHKVVHYIKTQQYNRLGKVLRKSFEHDVQLSDLRFFANREQSQPLKNALIAFRSMQPLAHELGIRNGDLLEISLFIEASLQTYINKKEYYLSEKITGLRHVIEYDPVTGYRFIHPREKQGSHVGRGSKKVVTKSILYDVSHPEIVARCDQSISIAHEKKITEVLQGLPGIVIVYAFTSRIEKNTHYHTMFAKLYQPGSFSTVLKNPKKFKLSLREKMSVALNLIKGLEGMQENNIVHRDMGSGNYLIDISKKRKNRARKITAVIADFGRGAYVWNSHGGRPQGHSAFTAPEGIFRKKLSEKDYFKTDIYALGLSLYYFLHEKKPLWLNPDYIKGELPLDVRYHNLVHMIHQATDKRRHELHEKIQHHRSMTDKEAFEELILQMISIDPDKRGTSTELREKMQSIVGR